MLEHNENNSHFDFVGMGKISKNHVRKLFCDLDKRRIVTAGLPKARKVINHQKGYQSDAKNSCSQFLSK